MRRLIIGCIVFLATPCLADSEPPEIPLIEGERIQITLKEFITVPRMSDEIRQIKRISTKEGDRIQLTLRHVVIEAQEIIVRCPQGPSTAIWKIEIAKDPKLMNITNMLLQE